MKTAAARGIVIENHLRAARTRADSGPSAISKNERIGIELGSSRDETILSHTFPTVVFP
jgi:hypothetical protein